MAHRSLTESYCFMAMERMAKDSIPPTPENYAVWYHYYANTNILLRRAIDLLAMSDEPISGEKCTELYSHFIRDDLTQGEIMNAIGGRIQKTLQDVTLQIESSTRQAEAFSRHLSNVASRLSGASLDPELTQAFDELTQSTQTLLAYNRELQNQVSGSSNELLELQQNLNSVRHEAITDSITGIINRKGFEIKFLEEAAVTLQENSPLSVLVVDVDQFKTVHDNYGSQTGDQVLSLVGQTLVNCIKGRDTAARFTDEEFVILLPNTKKDNAARFAEILKQTVGHKTVIDRASQERLNRVTLSIGVTEYKQGEPLNSCLDRALQALQKAKENGHDRVEVNAG